MYIQIKYHYKNVISVWPLFPLKWKLSRVDDTQVKVVNLNSLPFLFQIFVITIIMFKLLFHKCWNEHFKIKCHQKIKNTTGILINIKLDYMIGQESYVRQIVHTYCISNVCRIYWELNYSLKKREKVSQMFKTIRKSQSCLLKLNLNDLPCHIQHFWFMKI